ncbi:sensor histidine kinase [Acidicapsa ligni]|uniref:sensor histidine kinase n=1 Tax=Acidicapsa ligni TaxID=542300 RepID=UPI0021E0E08C|nr:histidine kinase dimerization/phospho-acceptor domain-containing protein [Acidicapsa ligni]
MPDDYQIPAIALIAALMLAFAYLHMRFRSVRTLLWLLALGCAEIQAVLVWLCFHYVSSRHAAIAMNVTSESARLLSTALFLSSLSPRTFRIGRFQILYVIPYIIPILIYSALYYGVAQHPSTPLFTIYCLLAFWAAAIGFVWGLQKGPIPIWLNVVVVVCAALLCVPLFIRGNIYLPLLLVESSNMLVTALLVLYSFKRFSPGVVLAITGFIAWAIPPILLTQTASSHALVMIVLTRAFVLGKVLVAMGLILLVLEDEVEKNQTAQRRERRVRLELEAYARQALTARSLEEFDRNSNHLCAMIATHSRFARVAMLVRGIGSCHLVGYAGMDGAMAGAVDSVAERLPVDIFAPGGKLLAPDSNSLDLDLIPWLSPGDDLERMQMTRLCAIAMLGPDNTVEGALLLAGLRNPQETLRADDLLPLEILAGRLQASRAQAMMLGKLIESERFAGVGQLAANVAQQLNNPLTVILGYAALLEDASEPGPERHGAEAIVVEARRMKSILERLSSFSRFTTDRFVSFSVADLITDIEQLHRTDFLRHSIEFRLSSEPDLPEIFGNVHQIRQALMHAMRFAIESALRLGPNEHKAVRVEATSHDGRVQILIGHSGHSFSNPERAFDSLSSGFTGIEATGIGLGLCAAIIREHRGTITAVNFEPTGAAVILDLPIS